MRYYYYFLCRASLQPIKSRSAATDCRGISSSTEDATLAIIDTNVQTVDITTGYSNGKRFLRSSSERSLQGSDPGTGRMPLGCRATSFTMSVSVKIITICPKILKCLYYPIPEPVYQSQVLREQVMMLIESVMSKASSVQKSMPTYKGTSQVKCQRWE